MPPEIAAAEQKISKEIDQIESALEHANAEREYDRTLASLDEKFTALYQTFNDWNLDIIGLNEENQKQRRLWLYKQIYDFLAFVEEQLVGPVFDDVVKQCPNFLSTFNHLGKFCHNVESAYNIKTDVEKQLDSNPQLRDALKAHLK